LVTFALKGNILLGSETTAHIRTGTLLGERMLTLESAGTGTMHPMALIPVSRTSSPYSLTEAVSDLTTDTAGTNTTALNQSLDTLAATLDQIAPQMGPAFDALTRLSRTLNSRNKNLGELFKSAGDVTGVLSERSQQVNKLILNSDVLLQVLVARRQEIVDLLANTSAVAKQLTALVHDNESKLAPTLERLNSVTAMLEKNRDNISKALPGLKKFEITVGEAISSMYAYSAFVPNFLAPQLFQPFLDYLWGFRTFDTARGPGHPSPVPRSLIPWPYNGIPVCPGCTLGGRVGGSQ
ncbi:MCE family protein, partial [Mycobacterium avium]